MSDIKEMNSVCMCVSVYVCECVLFFFSGFVGGWGAVPQLLFNTWA